MYYLKLRGDYFRYLIEIASESERNKLVETAEAEYSAGKKLAVKHLKPYDTVRIALAYNFSVSNHIKNNVSIIYHNGFGFRAFCTWTLFSESSPYIYETQQFPVAYTTTKQFFSFVFETTFQCPSHVGYLTMSDRLIVTNTICTNQPKRKNAEKQSYRIYLYLSMRNEYARNTERVLYFIASTNFEQLPFLYRLNND